MQENIPHLDPLPTCRTIDEVVAAIDSIIMWSIGVSSRLGYFAALYKRITLAVGVAIEQHVFQDGVRMERFDVEFAERYFAALNGYFHPGRYGKPAHSWQVTFDSAHQERPILVQHMLAGVNAHIGLDLGIVAQNVAGGAQLQSLREDFNRLNAVLASQVNGVVGDINELSPVLADLYAVLQERQIAVINESVKAFRDSAWRFAAVLAAVPDVLDPGARSANRTAGGAGLQSARPNVRVCQRDRCTGEPRCGGQSASAGSNCGDTGADMHRDVMRHAMFRSASKCAPVHWNACVRNTSGASR